MGKIARRNRDDALLKKANHLVNSGTTLKMVLKRCDLTYKQLMEFSKSPDWEHKVIFHHNVGKPSRCYLPTQTVRLIKEFSYRMNKGFKIPVKHIAWIFNRSERSVWRWIREISDEIEDSVL